MKSLPATIRRSGWLALACAVAVGWAGTAAGHQQPWKFMVFGDSRGNDYFAPVNTEILAELAEEVVAQRPAFLVFLGDFSLSGGAEALALWTNAMAPVLRAGIPICPVIGNHDFYSVDIISNLFRGTLPANGPEGDQAGTYAIGHREALILVLNQFVPTNYHRVNQPWLEAILATNTLPHVFAFAHSPAFKLAHADGIHSYPTDRDALWNSLSNANVRIYFAGHDHFYDHSRIDDGDGASGNDLHQVIAGTAGAPLYSDSAYDGNNGAWTPVRICHEAQYGYVLVDIAGHRATMSWHHRIATKLYAPSSDIFSYSAERLPLLKHAHSGNSLVLTWTDPGVLQSSPDAAGSFTNVPGASSPFVVTNLAGPRLFYRLLRP